MNETAAIPAGFYEGIVDHIAHPVFVKDRSFRFVHLNQAFCAMVGRPREVMLGKTDYDFFPKEEADFFRAKDAEMFASARTVMIAEEPATDAAGVVHVLATTKVPMLCPDSGAVTHLVGIIHDITRIKAAEEALRRTNDELAEKVRERTAALAQLDAVNRELEAFSYSVSHDLRAPLRSIDGFSQALLEDYAAQLDARGKDYLGRVRASAQRMGRLIDEMLALSRLTRAELRRERVDLGELARAIAGELSLAEPARRVELAVADEAIAVGDPALVRVALENLLRNAWKFTEKRAEARIELGVIDREGERIFFVRDDGAGFDMAYVDKLFRAFTRLHAMNEFPGTGIGLATVQRVVHRHGGRVWAEGRVGQGATFYFTLPDAG